jgi:hypothetical protein
MGEPLTRRANGRIQPHSGVGWTSVRSPGVLEYSLRVRRGDSDLLPHDDMVLAIGDRVRVLADPARMGIFCSAVEAFVLSVLHIGQHLLFGDPTARHRADALDQTWSCRWRASYTHSVGGPATARRSRPHWCRVPTSAGRGCADRAGHHRSGSIGLQVAAADLTLAADPIVVAVKAVY